MRSTLSILIAGALSLSLALPALAGRDSKEQKEERRLVTRQIQAKLERTDGRFSRDQILTTRKPYKQWNRPQLIYTYRIKGMRGYGADGRAGLKGKVFDWGRTWSI